MVGVGGSSPLSPTTQTLCGAPNPSCRFVMQEFAFTYVIKFDDGTLYVGSTPDLTRRLEQHQQGRGGRTTGLQS
ncbi:MAG: GIY-YIG nuclease family protein, partial [Verrucomicrobiota bacterium]